MSLQLPADLTATIQSFLVDGRYKDEVEVMRNALTSLKREDDLAAIQEGIEDMNAGRLTPARTVLEQARQQQAKQQQTKQPLNRDST